MVVMVLLLCEGRVGETGWEGTGTMVMLLGQSKGGLGKLEHTFTKWTVLFYRSILLKDRDML